MIKNRVQEPGGDTPPIDEQAMPLETPNKYSQLPLWSLCLSVVIGGGGLVAVGLFILFGPPAWLDWGWPMPADLVWDALLSGLFFIQHSVMIRPSVRQALERWIPGDYAKPLYAIASGLVLLAVVLTWQPAKEPILELSGAGRWAARLFAAGAVAGFFWTAVSLRNFDPLGTHAMLVRLGHARPIQMDITMRGPYRLVRHPFYFFAIVMIWSNPTVTLDRLMFNVLWTAWIWVGAVLEERDLLARYGEAYETYCKTVPRLLPYKWR